MSRYEVAHIREQGVDLIIVFLAASFGSRAQGKQLEIIASLQTCANSAGLLGTVVPVWQDAGGFQFIAPQNWHPFFRNITWDQLVMNCNKWIACD